MSVCLCVCVCVCLSVLPLLILEAGSNADVIAWVVLARQRVLFKLVAAWQGQIRHEARRWTHKDVVDARLTLLDNLLAILLAVPPLPRCPRVVF